MGPRESFEARGHAETAGETAVDDRGGQEVKKPRLTGKGRAVPFARPALPESLRANESGQDGSDEMGMALRDGVVRGTGEEQEREIGSGVRHEGVDWKMMLRLGTNWYVALLLPIFMTNFVRTPRPKGQNRVVDLEAKKQDDRQCITISYHYPSALAFTFARVHPNRATRRVSVCISFVGSHTILGYTRLGQRQEPTASGLVSAFYLYFLAVVATRTGVSCPKASEQG